MASARLHRAEHSCRQPSPCLTRPTLVGVIHILEMQLPSSTVYVSIACLCVSVVALLVVRPEFNTAEVKSRNIKIIYHFAYEKGLTSYSSLVSTHTPEVPALQSRAWRGLQLAHLQPSACRGRTVGIIKHSINDQRMFCSPCRCSLLC